MTLLGSVICTLTIVYGTQDLERWQERAFQGELLDVLSEMAAATEPGTDHLRLQAYLNQCIGDFDTSNSLYQQVLLQAPDDTDSRRRFADNLWRARQLQEATRVYQELQQLDSGSMALSDMEWDLLTLQRQEQESLLGKRQQIRWLFGVGCGVVILSVLGVFWFCRVSAEPKSA